MHRQFSVCVYCGARDGDTPVYRQAAEDVGRAIAENQWRLVFGAGEVGLMGAVARAALDGGAEALGVIPTHLMGRERGMTDLTALIVTETMHERKKVMFMNADAVVVLPGGAGSLDEFFEVLTWRQLGLHNKPMVLLNVEGYWDPLLALLRHVVDQGFAEPRMQSFVTDVPDVASLVTELRAVTEATQVLPKSD